MTLIHVAAAAIIDSDGRVLISKRHEHLHQGGLWEFPGGKLEPGESVEAALRRELYEELGIRISRFEPLIRVTHNYAECSVLLDVYRVFSYQGEPRGMEGQPLNWVLPEAMEPALFPAADRPIISALQLPSRYLITGENPANPEAFCARLESALKRGCRLLQLRAHGLSDVAYRSLLGEALALSQAHGARLLINRPQRSLDWFGVADGVHLNRHQLFELTARPQAAGLLGASCHDLQELKQAERLGLDYALLSPVLPTATHPEARPLGWAQFRTLLEQVNIPVYALGGMGMEQLSTAREHGAQGIAAIRGLW
ncbi:Nudix family hydrolase [endosymbiont of Ridgeia piscesae]|uniref:8-oxo-dGTP diphosphatase n=1 Tax=endosymbiont of Ridgeia piscesae TaxID=54398 RepID=A0A0T5Z7G7_9GAMM|nr:Nudix family hydrolase [endosymbiont of Ridgeia piscesae]KRT54558.1 8-oxo-dGTPase [endosymbiont of Ridgeia piscesae]KRT58860.1 8-oxo-dGTPase [endosymbiont of Ridgeia piscesae]